MTILKPVWTIHLNKHCEFYLKFSGESLEEYLVFIKNNIQDVKDYCNGKYELFSEKPPSTIPLKESEVKAFENWQGYFCRIDYENPDAVVIQLLNL